MARRDWSKSEVKAVVRDYLTMLEMELKGLSFNKTEYRQGLQISLNERSDGSIERKHQNISAVLIEHGYPYIDGYKPLGNYQYLLAEIVLERLEISPDLENQVIEVVSQEPLTPSVDDLLELMVDPPKPPGAIRTGYIQQGERARPTKVNYLEREARNSALGRAGELLIINYERARLIHEGASNLAEQVEHVADTEGDRAGFDVLSYEADSTERFIEVKTTSFGKETPFFVSRNQVETSIENPKKYFLYRVFRFSEIPRCFSVNGALNQTCLLTPEKYSGRIR